MQKSPRANSHVVKLLVVVMLLLGMGLFLYPLASNSMNERLQIRSIDTYDEATAAMTRAERQTEWDKAVRYNESLAGEPVHDPFLEGSGMALPEDYAGVLAVGGAMGYIDIPTIGVHLPIYHGTDEETLERGVGHIRQTALPIGGAGTHAVLTGHTGLPSAELFTNLDRLGRGDRFYITVLGETLAYEVDQVNTVLPDQVELLDPIAGEDHVTLITCTPYGVNSHRLLVRGVRTEYVPEEMQAAQAGGFHLSAMQRVLLLSAAGAACAVVLMCVLYAVWGRRRRRKAAERGRNDES